LVAVLVGVFDMVFSLLGSFLTCDLGPLN
jgi:hypothetical protein